MQEPIPMPEEIKEAAVDQVEATDADVEGVVVNDETVDSDSDDSSQNTKAPSPGMQELLDSVDKLGETQDSEQTQLTEEQFLAKLEKAKVDLLKKEGALEVALEKVVTMSEQNPDLLQQAFSDFDEIYASFKQIIGDISGGINQFGPGTGSGIEDTVFQKTDEVLLTARALEHLRQKKDLVFLRNSELKDSLQSETIKDAEDKIDGVVQERGGSEEDSSKLKKKLREALEFSDKSIDFFIDLNKGSSVDTFLAFLVDPIHTRGRDGQRLKFGTTEVDGVQVENIPLPFFREMFKDVRVVATALEKSARKINPEWGAKNSERLFKLKENPDKKEVKVFLLEMVAELFTNSSQREQNIKNFRLNFATELVNDGSSYTLDGTSFSFFMEQMMNNGQQLDKFWGISA